MGDLRARTSNRRLPVAVSPSGDPITVSVVEIVGARPGPTLGLISGVHGDEGLGPLALTGLLATIDPGELTGSIIAVPVANTPAFGLRTRTNAWDGGDLIRTWPGRPDGSITERTADAIFNDVIRRADALIDLHSGNPVLHEYWSIYGNRLGPRSQVTEDVERRSQAMAVAFGLDQILRGHPWFGTQMGAANAGVPAIITEIGGGSDFHRNGQHYIDVIGRGVRNVLIHLEMLTGEPVVDTEICDVFDIAEEFISSTTGGYWQVAVVAGEEVAPGTLIGRFLDPQTGEERDRIEATRPGVVLNARADWPHIGIGQWLLATGHRVEQVRRPTGTRLDTWRP
jgi:predicted deacylase